MLLAMVCPAGLRCPEGQAVAPEANANSCPRGFYCPHGDTTGDCPLGYNCPPGTGFPFSFPCTPGFFWDNSSAEEEDRCKPCPAGNYCDSPALTEPKACPMGFYCGEGSSKPEPCPEGTYSNKNGLSGPSECSPCGRGFYCAAPGQTGPSGPCKAGFYCRGRALTAVSQAFLLTYLCYVVLPTDGVTGDVCPAGAYCPPGSPLPIPCPPGTYSNVSGLRSLGQCLDCPPG
ncbi:hypothetical protein CIB84_006156 [Bambusicola thoracicus]|uniref:Tyrosine-protein kinase ephrin type A/B receptor-like domain-containing protein n=1 Tax=Bambusicola thoracicus TaxID=9083 RepID=A0A2P4T164_BAMTH|nr:hypothetical protein CIB84_006156 [Bambusicola thoracicus]